MAINSLFKLLSSFYFDSISSLSFFNCFNLLSSNSLISESMRAFLKVPITSFDLCLANLLEAYLYKLLMMASFLSICCYTWRNWLFFSNMASSLLCILDYSFSYYFESSLSSDEMVLVISFYWSGVVSFSLTKWILVMILSSLSSYFLSHRLRIILSYELLPGYKNLVYSTRSNWNFARI